MYHASLELKQELFSARHVWAFPSVTETNPKNLQLALTANKNLQAIGFTLSPDAINHLATLDRDELLEQYKQLYATCKASIGADVIPDSTIFYPNFPDQVMEMDELEHYLNQIIHYIGVYAFDETILPETEKDERATLLEGFERKPAVIELGTDMDVMELMRNYMFANNSLSPSKLTTLSRFMNESKEWVKWIATTPIPNKENRIKIADIIMKDENIPEKVKIEQLQDVLRDGVDVLRFAAELSNDRMRTEKVKQQVYVWEKETPRDRHLEWRTKRIKQEIHNTGLNGNVYFKLHRPEQRIIKCLLNSCHDIFTAVWLRPDLFEKLGQHIDAKDEHYLRLKKAFDNLYQGNKVNELGEQIKSPDAIVTAAIEAVRHGDKDSFKQLELAASMFPGVFSRNFFHAVDVCHNKKEIQNVCDIYGKYCDKVPVRELLKLYNLVDIQTDADKRIIYMSNQNKFREEPLPESRDMSENVRAMKKAAIFTAITKALQGHAPMHIYIDPKADRLLLPENGERNASKGSVLTTGSTYDGNPNCNIVRQFIWWTNMEGSFDSYQDRVDIDTAITFFDADMNYITDCYYANHKATANGVTIAVHSGDIVDGGNANGPGSMEAMDFDKELARSVGARYAVLSVSSYSSQPYCKMPNIKFGFMQREGSLDLSVAGARRPYIFNGEVFEPTTVECCIDLNTNATQTVPVIYDIEADCFIWIDKPIEAHGIINPHNSKTLETIDFIIKRFSPSMNPTPSVADLFMAYAAANNGTIVDSPEQADLIIAFDKDDCAEVPIKDGARVLSSFEMDVISAEFMSAKDAPEIPVETTIESSEFDEDVGDNY